MNNISFHEIVGAGFVKVVGETRKDYLQRQSSNDLSLLSSTLALPNILTAPNGRILEIFTVIADEHNYWLATPAGRGESLTSYFQKRIFFNDQVEIHDRSKDWMQFRLLGAKWIEFLPDLFQAEITTQPNSVSTGQIGQWNLKLIADKSTGTEASFLLIAPREAAALVKASLQENATIELGDIEMDVLRIGATTPGPGEFFGDFTPFEIGMDDRVSASKGCYPGQEVLARQITYDKITRSLVRLTANGQAKSGMNVMSEGKVVGKVTSATQVEHGSIALAVVKKPYNQAGANIELKNQEHSLAAKILSPKS